MPTERSTRCAMPTRSMCFMRFQKKSKTGIKTPKPDLNLIAKRLHDLIDEKDKRR